MFVGFSEFPAIERRPVTPFPLEDSDEEEDSGEEDEEEDEEGEDDSEDRLGFRVFALGFRVCGSCVDTLATCFEWTRHDSGSGTGDKSCAVKDSAVGASSAAEAAVSFNQSTLTT